MLNQTNSLTHNAILPHNPKYHHIIGVYHEWKANSTGRSAQTVREFLEKNYSAEIAAKDDQVIKLAIRALLEVVQGKNLEVAIMTHKTPMKLLSTTEIEKIVAEIEKEKEEDMEQRQR